MTPKELEKILKLMTKYQVDTIQMEGITITKKMHLPKVKPLPAYKLPPKFNTPVNHTQSPLTPENLFYSSSAPRLNDEVLKNYGLNVPNEDKS